MKHFIDKLNTMTKQANSAACIIDSSGNVAGRILVRFTDSQIGWNHEVGVLFHPAGMDLRETARGNTYSTPGTLYHLLTHAGVKCYTWNGKRIGDYTTDPDGQKYDCLSTFNDIAEIRYNRRKYRLAWVL